jgi:hypothetical protein
LCFPGLVDRRRRLLQVGSLLRRRRRSKRDVEGPNEQRPVPPTMSLSHAAMSGSRPESRDRVSFMSRYPGLQSSGEEPDYAALGSSYEGAVASPSRSLSQLTAANTATAEAIEFHKMIVPPNAGVSRPTQATTLDQPGARMPWVSVLTDGGVIIADRRGDEAARVNDLRRPERGLGAAGCHPLEGLLPEVHRKSLCAIIRASIERRSVLVIL